MSLWPVDDEATQLLMTKFYENLFRGATNHAALEQAKKAVRSHPGYEKAEYWSAFILLDGVR